MLNKLFTIIIIIIIIIIIYLLLFTCCDFLFLQDCGLHSRFRWRGQLSVAKWLLHWKHHQVVCRQWREELLYFGKHILLTLKINRGFEVNFMINRKVIYSVHPSIFPLIFKAIETQKRTSILNSKNVLETLHSESVIFRILQWYNVVIGRDFDLRLKIALCACLFFIVILLTQSFH